MSSFNEITLIGRLGRDPEVKVGQNGEPYCFLPLAVDESWTDKNGQKQGSTEWFNLSFSKKLADVVGQYCRKGSLVFVKGSAKATSYEGKDGKIVAQVTVRVFTLQLLDPKGKDQQQQPAQGGYGAPQGGYQQPQPKGGNQQGYGPRPR
ncbi:MAG: hypothetical protein A2600_13785 [Candidatus Lambdaproteobacteria bacterium RIFOXYD1_FULL_56_27]|uniref:Single-stranded DNA-binding protein n=1 Tax=Candidatus Lambdaproteobacteria bacterium RIFOXYD2_FULL_56_26 TaxID=1817773 RepID=A0A1F6GLI7_9PROT|nr:MAG: hypothetical protein A2557_00575 [Candidatus Lambdaproteobacteria bacterium RIFOXYD2_FULL_56_26]OGH01561.1 MAG: hypothetical protein A2426_11345 [Candidatus Lambdaproteobacteria bacterium RIFOXYC1_FULL_56_13]OGH08825.1 MAG: hypothetical protein A2600_13785 [Candidatus Lambdaproteobacteria bacterium RIFOXYD1_FULL_56_27]